jgi:multidrug efflux pump subunit AcrA (membrane-fusion protein)
MMVAAALFAAGCGMSSRGAPAPNTEKHAGATEPLAVTVGPPARATLRRHVSQPGQIQAFEQTAIVAKIPGYVHKWLVDIGDVVKQGQVLAELWVPELEAEVKQKDAQVQQAAKALTTAQAQVITADALVREAEAGLRRAEAARNYWQSQSERFARLTKNDVLDKQTQEETQNQFRAAAASLQEVQAKVTSARANHAEKEAARAKAEADVRAAEADRQRVAALAGYAKLTAPYGGVVTRRNVNTGQFVQPATSPKGDVLFVVERADPVRVFVAVPEADAAWVRDGVAALVRVQVLPGQEFKGAVTRSSWSLDRTTRTLLAEIDLPNADGRLRPGMYAYATLTAERPDVLSLPASAIVTEGDVNRGYQTYCYEVADGKGRRLLVEVGAGDGTRVEVLQKQIPPSHPGGPPRWVNFTGQEQIVLNDAAALKDGEAVKVGR